MVKAPKTTKTRKGATGAKNTTKSTKETKQEPAQQAAPETTKAPKVFNTPMDEENRKLFLNVHLPEVKKLRERLASATANLRNAYKTAKAEGSFTKADFDTAIQIEDAEREAKAKARIARQLTIARYMGKSLGAQLELFLEPDRTPASDLAYEEGKQAALENRAAKPDYDPSTEQYRRYMEGYHSVSEARVKDGIKKKETGQDEQAAYDAADAKQKAKNDQQRAADAAVFEKTETVKPEEVTSGVPTSRAQFLAQQQLQKVQENHETGDSEFSKRN